MYNLSKVKSWIKKSAKSKYLMYDPENELVSDGAAIIRVIPEMKPTLLEVFGHLKGGQIRSGGFMEKVPEAQQYMDPAVEGKKIFDSTLRFTVAEDKRELRVLYLPVTHEKKLIDEQYAVFFRDFESRSLKYADCGAIRPILVMSGINTIQGVLLEVEPKKGSSLDKFLNTFQFVEPKTEE